MPHSRSIHAFAAINDLEPCIPLELQPVPLWFIAYVYGPVGFVILARLLHKAMMSTSLPMSKTEWGKVYASMEPDKRKKWRIVVFKGFTSSLGLWVWLVISIQVFIHWHEPESWMMDGSHWSTYYRTASALLVSVYAFDLIYGDPQWDTWVHHLGCITLQLILLCSRSHREDEPDYMAWGCLYQMSTCVDQGIFWGMAVYYLAGDTLPGLRRKLTCSKVVLWNLALTVVCMNALPLALTISQWTYLDEVSRPLLLLAHLPFLPDQINSLIKCRQIVQHNARRVAKAEQAQRDKEAGNTLTMATDQEDTAKLNEIEGHAV